MNNKNMKDICILSRKRFFICRLILIASLLWSIIDLFQILTLTNLLATRSVDKDKNEPTYFKERITSILNKESLAPISTTISVDAKKSLEIHLNENPKDWPGEQGKPVILPKHLEKIAQERFKENYFNVIASDTIALNRSVGEQRNKKCLQKVYDIDLPNTSIVIIFHNEANSTLLRGLTSIVRKTPLRYLKEIILVDDASVGREYLHEPLDRFVKTLPVNVKIFRNEVRQGLIRSRLRGAAAATGDTLTFLDAHIETTHGWVEPLLHEIKKNR